MIDAGVPSAAAEALLEATNRFLRAEDRTSLARALVDAAVAMFGPSKTSVTLRLPGGAYRIVASDGYTAGELAIGQAAVDLPSPLAVRAMGGELCTDDPGSEPLLERLPAYGGRALLSLPIPGPDVAAGVLVVLYAEPRAFDPAMREAARGLCAQAALALRLLEARAELRHHARVSSALLAVSQRLALLADPGAVPPALVDAIRATTGASVALVVRWDGVAERTNVLAAHGLGAGTVDALRELAPGPDRFRSIQEGLDGSARVLVPPFDPEAVPAAFFEGQGFTAVGGAPVVVDGATWGFLVVATRDGDPDILETGAELMSGLASIAAGAIERTEAIRELARSRDELESIVAERTVQLRQALDELRVASQAKSDFLSNVSHELRTPLTSILGFSELLLQDLEGPLTTAQREDIQTIEAASRRLLELIEDLIDVSRIEAGRVRLALVPTPLAPFLAGVVAEMRPLAERKGVALEIESVDAVTVASADPQRLHDILVNLLGNAVKFTPPGGRIGVVAGPLDDRCCRIDVVDTGIGIAPAEHERVFERFHRAAGPEISGTGLGLAIARELARLHGGDLTVDSQVGRGSRFRLAIPSHPGDGPRAPGDAHGATAAP